MSASYPPCPVRVQSYTYSLTSAGTYGLDPATTGVYCPFPFIADPALPPANMCIDSAPVIGLLTRGELGVESKGSACCPRSLHHLPGRAEQGRALAFNREDQGMCRPKRTRGSEDSWCSSALTQMFPSQVWGSYSFPVMFMFMVLENKTSLDIQFFLPFSSKTILEAASLDHS